MPAEGVRYVLAARDAWDEGFAIAAQQLNDKVLSRHALCIKASTPKPDVTLAAAKRRILKALSGLELYGVNVPDEVNINLWSLGRVNSTNNPPFILSGRDYNMEEKLTAVVKLLKSRKWNSDQWYEYIVEPVEAHANEWRKWFDKVEQAIDVDGESELDDPKLRWDRDRSTLYRDDVVIKRIRSTTVAKNVVQVLDVFQEKGWPPRIDDPLGSSKKQQRLHETIKRLNDHLDGIRFRADGTGKGIVWEPV